jgi:hypothetical protein
VDDEPSDRAAAAGQRAAAVLAGRALSPVGPARRARSTTGCAPLAAISCSSSTPTLFHGPSSRGRSPLSSAISSSSAQGRASDQLAPRFRRVADLDRYSGILSPSRSPDSRESPLDGEVRPAGEQLTGGQKRGNPSGLGPKGAALRKCRARPPCGESSRTGRQCSFSSVAAASAVSGETPPSTRIRQRDGAPRLLRVP